MKLIEILFVGVLLLFASAFLACLIDAIVEGIKAGIGEDEIEILDDEETAKEFAKKRFNREKNDAIDI